jgi:hypothetical protein
VLNFSRVILLRQEMVRRGDGDKSVWALDAGWTALPEDWTGRPAPQGSDTALVQGERLARAYQRLEEEWPWMGLVCMLQWQPDAAADDPVWGTALLNAQGAPTALLDPVGRLIVDEDNAVYPGLTLDPKPFLSPTYHLPVADFFFWGTDLELWIRHDQAPGTLMTVLVDGEEQPAIDLGDGSGVVRMRIAHGLPAGVHRVRLQDAATRMDSLVAIQVGYRPAQSRYWFGMYVGLLAVVQLAVIAVSLARRLPWRAPWRRLRRAVARLVPWGGVAYLAMAWALLLLAPAMPLRLLGLVLAGLGALLGLCRPWRGTCWPFPSPR